VSRGSGREDRTRPGEQADGPRHLALTDQSGGAQADARYVRWVWALPHGHHSFRNILEQDLLRLCRKSVRIGPQLVT
jgi:hypothetical protein